MKTILSTNDFYLMFIPCKNYTALIQYNISSDNYIYKGNSIFFLPPFQMTIQQSEFQVTGQYISINIHIYN